MSFEVVLPVVLEVAVPRVHLRQYIGLVLQMRHKIIQFVPVKTIVSRQKYVNAFPLWGKKPILRWLPSADVQVRRDEQPRVKFFNLKYGKTSILQPILWKISAVTHGTVNLCNILNNQLMIWRHVS